MAAKIAHDDAADAAQLLESARAKAVRLRDDLLSLQLDLRKHAIDVTPAAELANCIDAAGELIVRLSRKP